MMVNERLCELVRIYCTYTDVYVGTYVYIRMIVLGLTNYHSAS